VVCVCLTYSFEHGAPPSLAIAQSRRLLDVTLPIVPFTKQMARAQLMTTPAARLPVAWMISSISGLPVGVVRMASGLGMQKSRTMIIVRPLFSMELDWLALSCTDADADADSGMVYLRDSANGHAGYHRDGSIPSRPWHLLSHMSYGIVPDQRKSRLQQAKHLILMEETLGEVDGVLQGLLNECSAGCISSYYYRTVSICMYEVRYLSH
jgi:hypothetical protein